MMLVDYSSATTLPFHYAIHYVVGGQAPPEPIPWQVSIRLLTPAPEHRVFNVPRHWCGGIILDRTTILSAAHCFYGRKDGTGKQWADTHDFIIRAGVIDKDSTKGQDMEIEEF